MDPGLFPHFDFYMCLAPRGRAFDFETSKAGASMVFFCAFWIQYSCHSGLHFLNISTSKRGSNVVCFAHFWLRNVLRPKTAGGFWTSQFPKVLRSWRVLYMLISIFVRATTVCTLEQVSCQKCSEAEAFSKNPFRDFSTYSCTLTLYILFLSLFLLSRSFLILLFLLLSPLLLPLSISRKFDL